LRAVIVDDEPLAREGLRDAIDRLGLDGLEVVALCESGVAAIDVIQRVQPELLLLDVVMPVLDGFATLERLEPDAAAVDFLVKPVSPERLRVALERAQRRVAEARALRASLEPSPEPQPTSERYRRQLVIPEKGRQIVLPVGEIEWIEGDTYYVRVHAPGRARLLRERLSKLEASLDPRDFVRTHRSALVRAALIREVRRESPYSFSALLTTGARVPVSRERVAAVEKAVGR
jgi:two-component system LytT family response regulator